MNKLSKILLSVFLGIAIVLGFFTVANRVNEKMMHEYIDTFGAVEIENQLTPQTDEDGATYFVTDEEFRVMHLTDIHIGGSVISASKDKMAMNAIAAMVEEEKPDLIIVTGDISFAVPWGGTLNNRFAHEMFAHFMENLGVWWTVAFGNHDSENYNPLDRSEVAAMYESENLKYCLFDRGPEDIWGECNHYISVRNSDGFITRSFIIMDTNAYTKDDPLGFAWIYDNIHEDQIQWYEDIITKMNNHNLAHMELEEIIDGRIDPVKTMLFVHIPLMEVRDAYNQYVENGESENLKYLGGSVNEPNAPYVYCSEISEEMFETMVRRGSTDAMFYGHDHLNNIVLEYEGITLSYGYAIDYFAYWQIAKSGSQRGCTMINCSPDGDFEIIHENYYQDKYTPQYEKETVDITK